MEMSLYRLTRSKISCNVGRQHHFLWLYFIAVNAFFAYLNHLRKKFSSNGLKKSKSDVPTVEFFICRFFCLYHAFKHLKLSEGI